MRAKQSKSVPYNAALGERICALLRDGLTLNQVCKLEGMPTEAAVRQWASNPDHPITANYARAREIGYQRMADEIIQISDDSSGDTYEDADGNERVNHDHIQRSRLRVDTRKWLLSKALPKMYGDKVALTDAEGGPVQIVVQSGVPRASDG